MGNTLTIGGSGQDGGLQLKTADGDDTIFLGSDDKEAHALFGTNGRKGRIQLKNGDGLVTVEMEADTVLGTGGELHVSNADGEQYVSVSSGKLNVNVDGLPTITLDGTLATVTIGLAGAGTINVQDGKGNNTIVLDGRTGNITCKTVNGK
jgi:hypothetical protein